MAPKTTLTYAPPNEADSYLPILKATRTNLKLCASAAKAGK